MDCTTKISKSGKNLFARIPDRDRVSISRGDLVKITVLERAQIFDKKQIKEELQEFLKNPNGEKLQGTIMGFPVTIPIAKIINSMGKEKAEKLFLEALVN